MYMRKAPIIVGTLITALALSLGGTPVLAESACKGLEKPACEKNASCTWVDSFTRKDGVKVSGYCRGKPSQSSNKK